MKALLALLLLNPLAALGQPAQIILLRHAEKPDDPSALHLSSRGEDRARALASLLGTNSTLTSDAPIAALYATHVTKHDHGERPGETLAPLATKLGLPVQTPYASGLYSPLARAILANTNYVGKTVVICWTHRNMADLASALGVKPQPAPWKAKTFDRLWIIQPGGAKAGFKNLPQRQLEGDSKQ